MNIGDIKYIAGLLEGEGHFEFINVPRITLNMTDEDVIVKARNLMSPSSSILLLRDKRPNRKQLYSFRVHGSLAIQWMLTIYFLMGKRRKERIKDIIDDWKNNDMVYIENIRMLAKSMNMTYYEAKKFFNEVQ